MKRRLEAILEGISSENEVLNFNPKCLLFPSPLKGLGVPYVLITNNSNDYIKVTIKTEHLEERYEIGRVHIKLLSHLDMDKYKNLEHYRVSVEGFKIKFLTINVLDTFVESGLQFTNRETRISIVPSVYQYYALILGTEYNAPYCNPEYEIDEYVVKN